MKNLLFIFILMVIVTKGIAQTTASTQTDEKAIRKVIETETRAARDNDYNKWINCFANSPDVVFGFHEAVPTHMVRGYDQLAALGKKLFPAPAKPSKATITFEEYHSRIKDNTAFISCLETITQPDGTKLKTYKGIYLEKMNGEWKLVGHLFSNVPDKAAAVKK